MKPVIMMIDDDPEVLNAIERDLQVQSEYHKDYRVLKAASGMEGLHLLKELQRRNENVALLLSDHRMPQMSGIEFLRQARQLYPHARRVLLTAYADTEAAIQAINEIQLDFYLLKPWNPPEERLYPILNDLLHAWKSEHRPDFEGIRVIGHRWSPLSHDIRDFLSRNQIPYQSFDIEIDADGQRLCDSLDLEPEVLPVVILTDGSHLVRPTLHELAEKIGLCRPATLPFYDLIVIGAGPAGLAAGVYGASEGLSTVMIEREAPGGQAGMSSRIENYLGFPAGLTGSDLTRRAVVQAKRFGAELLLPQEVISICRDSSSLIVTLADGTRLGSHAILISTGVSYRTLDVPGMEALSGAGVYYGAAMVEARSCQNQDVYLVGGANSAGQTAMFFARHAQHVTLLVRGDSLEHGMSQYLIAQIKETPNITVRPSTQVTRVEGDAQLEAITLRNLRNGNEETVPASGLFIFIGAVPRTDWLREIVERDQQGYVLTGPDLVYAGKRPANWPLERDPLLLETSIPGVFAAGDVRSGSIKRVASSVGEGAIAVSLIHQYLKKVR